MQADQRRDAFANLRLQMLGESRLALRRWRRRRRRGRSRSPRRRCAAAPPGSALGDDLARGGDARDAVGEDRHRRAEIVGARARHAREPGHRGALRGSFRAAAIASAARTSWTQQRAKASSGSTARSRRARAQAGASAPSRRRRAIARRAELVQQHDDRLAGPRQQLQSRRDVAGSLGRLGRVDQVEHHVGLVAHVLQRLLAATRTGGRASGPRPR